MSSVSTTKGTLIEGLGIEAAMDRFDLLVLGAFHQDPKNVQHTRRHIINNWRDDNKYKSLGLSSSQGFEQISPDEEDRAVKNLVDYWFEPYFLPTMNIGQLRDYFLAFEDIYNLELTCDINMAGEKPLVIDAFHHYAGFSALFSLYKFFVTELGYKRILILNGKKNTDPRLELVGTLISRLTGCEYGNVLMEKNWWIELGKQVNETTVVFYMGDMPPLLFTDTHKKSKTSSEISLYTQSGDRFSFEGFSVSKFITRRIKAHHISITLPEEKTLHICEWEGRTKFDCPVYEWIYWPALFRLYTQFY